MNADNTNEAPRRHVGDRVKEAFGNFEGTITEVHDVPGYPDLAEYSIVWDDGEYADEIWTEQDLEPLPEGDLQ